MVHIDTFINTIRCTERKIVPQHSPSVLILMVYKVPGEGENNKSYDREDPTEDLTLLMTLSNIVPKSVANKVCEGAIGNSKLAKKRYKVNHDRNVLFAPMFLEGDGMYLDRTSLFRPVAKESAAEGYSKFLLKK